MKHKIDLIVANPAGNTTILVLTPISREDYQEVSHKLLAIDYGKAFGVRFDCRSGFNHPEDSESLFGEQVAFVRPAGENQKYPTMEMSGLEFCGNASRAFAYYTVREMCKGNQAGISENLCAEGLSSGAPVNATISVSGCNHPINAHVDVNNRNVEIDMPLPVNMIHYSSQDLEIAETDCNNGGILVNLDGISHLVLEDVTASAELYEKIKAAIYRKPEMNPPALGVIFVNSSTNEMTPVVYVKDMDTTYWEGSCASGATAVSCALAARADDGVHEYDFKQPAGTLHTEVTKENDKITRVTLSGLIEISPVIKVEI